MAEENKIGIIEVVAAAALVFLLWYALRKRLSVNVQPGAAAKKCDDEQFCGSPNFNLKDYCQHVMYNPLSQSNLAHSQFFGKGWCVRGDGSRISEAPGGGGFGSPYASEQAEAYRDMKQAEAIMINNKLCIQFRLINTGATPITTDVLNTTTDPTPVSPSVLSAPVAIAASEVGETQFSVNWNIVSGATGYYLDIASDAGFTSMIPGCDNKDVGNASMEVIDNMIFNSTFYYRVRAYTATETSANSNVITVSTLNITEVVIGTQTWSKFNVDARVALSRVYNDDELNRSIYGGLYSYSMIAAIEALYPGWHVPDDSEFVTLRDFLGGFGVAGAALKEAGLAHWTTPNTGATNSSGFTALGAGNFGTNTGYWMFNLKAWFLSSSSVAPNVHFFAMSNNDTQANTGISILTIDPHFSVRLIKD